MKFFLLAFVFILSACSETKSNPISDLRVRSSEVNTEQEVSEDSDFRFSNKLLYQLRYLLVTEVMVESNLKKRWVSLAREISEDLWDCGFSYEGPKCLDGKYQIMSYYQFLDYSGRPLLAVEIEVQKKILFFVFYFDEVRDLFSNNFDIYLKKEDKITTQRWIDYFSSSAKVQKILGAVANLDFESEAKVRIKNPRNVKELYHLAHHIRNRNQELSSPDMNLDNILLQAFAAQTSLLNFQGDVHYTYLLYFHLDTFMSAQNIKKQWAEVFLNSEHKDLKKFGATELMGWDLSRQDLRGLIFEAFDHPKARVRTKALRLSGEMKLSPEDEVKIILKIGDEDIYVREVAVQMAQKFVLSEFHRPVLEELLKSPRPEVWAEADILYKKLSSAQDPVGHL